MECHLIVQFETGEMLHFRAEEAAAHRFAVAAEARRIARVTIGDSVYSWLPVMPYQRLWL